jgi:site-specific recombinase XerD
MSATTSILIQMFDYLVKVGHSLANPFQGCEVEKPVGHPSGSRGAIPPLILDHVLNVMDRRAKTSPTEMRLYWRNRFVLVLYCRTGLRATEGVQANMSDIQEIPNPATGRTHWALCVQEELVHLDAVVLEALIAYRRAFLLPDVPPPGETLGLVLSPFTPAAEETSIYGSPNSRRGRRMWKAIRTRQSIRNIVRDEFNAAAAQLPADSPQAALLKRASTQWLRHTRGAALAAAGVDTPILAKAMRYRSVRTAKTFEQVNFFDVAGLSDQ